MEAFLVSTGVVALAEIGDKTQLLALLLAARYRQPVPILLGIFVATVANHALAGFIGTVAAGLIGDDWLRWVVGLSFLAVAAWMLIPDRLDEEEVPRFRGHGAFLAALVCMFLAEMGDKTQIATIVLAARFESLLAVIAGTTAGMMIANTPAVLLGEAAARHVPLKLVHGAAAAIFAVIGITVLLGFDGLT
ncbi:TMEM165/GDT1 family protein [Oceanibaculum nanhaiense]|uniref:TMEM165/GDT1 family protein n=1 Tax=Oceanibaculum nanhaiense TaxID=1909734 RepID=UPI000A3CE18E|nr:TMEM165/GDT1 family protein [Oceanibaculum nanhaiense]